MHDFLSCDWGTSSFRLRWINGENLSTLAEINDRQGIAAIYKEWIAYSGPESERIFFYQRHLLKQLNMLESASGSLLKDMPVVVSGMASSSIGMKEIPYTPIPFNIADVNFNIFSVAASGNFPHQLMIISGVKTASEAMRGEETMLAGCDIGSGPEEQLFIFPGTHSKHITVRQGLVSDMKTYMTGEFFELLSAKSILSGSVKKEEGMPPGEYFKNGVKEGAEKNLLHAAFHVRTNTLFNKLSLGQNYHFLSGLLIGAELSELSKAAFPVITVVCNDAIKPHYQQALEVLFPGQPARFVNADEALVKGQYRIAMRIA